MLFHFRKDQRTTAIAAGVIGNIIEWYDFALYGFMASVLSDVFFPSEDRLVSLIATYGVFAVGFIMRPLGSVIFGWLGDTIGRSRTLLLSVAMMAFPTLVLGLLPSYEVAGILAPLLLVLVRMIQGLSVGGEFSTSVTYLVETAPPKERGLAGSWANTGSLIGMLLGSGAAAIATDVFSADVLASWGWRVPFLVGGILGVIAILLRKNLPESPQFKLYEKARCPNSPLKEAFTCNRVQMAQGVLFSSGYGALFYLALVYLPTWVSEISDISLSEAMQANTLTLALLLPVIPLGGWVSDRLIRRTRLLVWDFTFLGAACALAFIWMQNGNPIAIFVGQIITGLILAVPLGAAPAMFAELFPEDDRLTGYSIVFNVGLGLVGGTTPMLASWLILISGSALAPVALTLIWAVIAIGALMWMRDRSREPLLTHCGTSIHHVLATSSGSELDTRGGQRPTK
ncbi:MFS transporter [Methylophaga sp.]|uniref:MFS transporter n=1 Tax=Methylophaga sp. TaxID=2024840 RepID=UPI0013FEF6CB|nr:MFS transporter [Methylophaga sp.]MTI62529.1 MHS family MFS transporter [Methylophaga sp.]